MSHATLSSKQHGESGTAKANSAAGELAGDYVTKKGSPACRGDVENQPMRVHAIPNPNVIGRGSCGLEACPAPHTSRAFPPALGGIVPGTAPSDRSHQVLPLKLESRVLHVYLYPRASRDELYWRSLPETKIHLTTRSRFSRVTVYIRSNFRDVSALSPSAWQDRRSTLPSHPSPRLA